MNHWFLGGTNQQNSQAIIHEGIVFSAYVPHPALEAGCDSALNAVFWRSSLLFSLIVPGFTFPCV